MTFPNYAAKHTHDTTPLVTPERFLRHLRERGQVPPDFVPPSGIILLYQRPYARALLAREPHHPSAPFPEWFHLLDRTDGRVGVLAFFGIGGPAVAVAVELLAALGTRRFMNLGAAGGLQTGDRVGELVVCDGAVRDEGLSHHYLPPARYALPSTELTDALADRLIAGGQPFKRGVTWTIDAPYRETAEELRHYRDEGVLTVEMEAAAVFAVAQHRAFQAAAAFVLSDTLTDTDWTPDFGSPEILRGLDILVNAAIEVLQ
jgi:nucleoside phosphorylase